MAKRKHAKKAEAPAKKVKSNYGGWIALAVIVLIIIVIALLVNQAGKVATPTQPTTPTTPQGGLQPAAVPEFDSKCTTAIGIIPGTEHTDNPGAETADNTGMLTATFKDTGRSGIEGVYLEFTDSTGKTIYKVISQPVAAGGNITISVDLKATGSELGSPVKSFVVYPIENGKACKNQRDVVINY